MRGTLRLLAAAGVLAFIVVGPVGANTRNSGTAEPQACDNDTVTLEGPTNLWPPNHKDIPYTVTFHGESPEDDGKILATEGTHDEQITDAEGNPGEEVGSGKPNNGADIQPPADSDTVENGEAQTAHTIRAERSGRGDGRTYTILWEVFAAGSDPESDEPMCMGTFAISVPHDMGSGNDA